MGIFGSAVPTAASETLGLDNPKPSSYPNHMTDRLYYRDSFLYNFDAEVRSAVQTPRPALILDRTAFYPTSGGQIHATGGLLSPDARLHVTELSDNEDCHIVL